MPNSSKSTGSTITTIAKTNLAKEKEMVNEDQQKEEEKQANAGKEQPDIMEIPSDAESGSELTIEEQTARVEPQVEAVTAKVDGTSMEGETREVLEHQEVKEAEQEPQEREQQAMEMSLPMQEELAMVTAGTHTPTPDHTIQLL